MRGWTMTGKLSVGLCGLFLAGCITTGNERLLDDAILAQIRVGETTSAQVAQLLGDPSERRSTQMSGATHESWGYRVSTSIINPLEYVLLYGFLYNGIGLPDTRRELYLAINPDGIVVSLMRQTTTYDMGAPFIRPEVTSRVVSAVAPAGPSGPSIRYEDSLRGLGP